MQAIWTLLVRARTAALLIAGATLMISAALLIVGRGFPAPAPNATVIHAANPSPSVSGSAPASAPARGTHHREPPRPARSAPVIIQVVGPSLPVEQLGSPAPPPQATVGPPGPPPPASSSDTPAPAHSDSSTPSRPDPTPTDPSPSPTDG